MIERRITWILIWEGHNIKQELKEINTNQGIRQENKYAMQQ